MNRRSFAGSGLATLTAIAAPRETGAHPVRWQDKGIDAILSFSDLEGVGDVAQREFYLDARTLADLVSAEPMALLTAAATFADDDQSGAALVALRTGIPDQVKQALARDSVGSKRTSAGQTGDETIGLDLQIEFVPDSNDSVVNVGIALIRGGSMIQVIVVMAFDDALDRAVTIAGDLNGPWDGGDPAILLPGADAFLPRLPMRAERMPD